MEGYSSPLPLSLLMFVSFSAEQGQRHVKGLVESPCRETSEDASLLLKDSGAAGGDGDPKQPVGGSGLARCLHSLLQL